MRRGAGPAPDAPCRIPPQDPRSEANATATVVARVQHSTQIGGGRKKGEKRCLVDCMKILLFGLFALALITTEKGYGFIRPQDGGRDVFVHFFAVERAGLPGLNKGQVIEYEEVSTRGRTSVGNLKVQR
jgi:CspA family cold shock protein